MEPLTFPTSIVTERRRVPNLFPFAEPTPYRIAIIGEAPGEHEENHGYPFVGPSGHHLDTELAGVSIDRSRCFLGNVCQVRPPGNKIEAFAWDSSEIQSGLIQLKHDLDHFNPHLCLLLGGTPLRAARGPTAKITAWQGSLFRCDIVNSPFYGRKCVAALHPAYVLREFEGNPLFRLVLKRAREEGTSPDLVLPQREFLTGLSSSELIHIMDTWPSGQRCSVDIEGGLPSDKVNDSVKADAKSRRHIGWRCVSLSATPSRAFVIAFWKFSEEEQGRLLRSFARLMERLDVPKLLQNSLYDAFVMAFGYGIHIRNVTRDTMLSGWEIYCELPKGLSTQAWIFTREPHWKDEEMYESNGENLARGCGKDTTVTAEISIVHEGILAANPRGLAHYDFNIQMLNPLLYMELRGIRYDTENVARQLVETKKEIAEVAEAINRSAGRELRGAKGSLSAQRLAKCLYEEKGYPPQYKKEAGRKTEKLTTDVEALLSLRRKLAGDPFLNAILRHRHLEGVIETLEIKPDADGRVRCGYNVVGTETGRLTCYTSPTGAGANLTTITKKLRVNYCADPDFDFFQCDLSGADGWTVGAHSARLGDPTMLDDYLFGLKPAKILALLYQLGADVNRLDRRSLKNLSRVVESGSDIYEASKVMQHGSSYLMGIPTGQKHLMIKSFKISGNPMYIEHRDMVQLQNCFFSRYAGVRTWHQWAEATLASVGCLTSASGHTRQFFGRRWGQAAHDTVKQFLADEPQQNTTYATNLAMLRLWNDPENRRRDGSLIIEPLHQVHDALCGQWPKAVRDWARAKVRSYFDNPIEIAGMKITIPFEGAFGPSWGDLPNSL